MKVRAPVQVVAVTVHHLRVTQGILELGTILDKLHPPATFIEGKSIDLDKGEVLASQVAHHCVESIGPVSSTRVSKSTGKSWVSNGQLGKLDDVELAKY